MNNIILANKTKKKELYKEWGVYYPTVNTIKTTETPY